MRRYIAFGVMLGILAGFILPLFFPSLLSFDTQFKMSMNKQLGLGEYYYSPKSGGILTGSGLFIFLFGLIGGLSGYIFYRLLNFFKR